MMVDPRLAEHEPTETLRPLALIALVIPRIVSELTLLPILGLRNRKCMRRRPEPDHRLSRLQERIDMLHLLIRQIAKARLDDHQVRAIERFETGDDPLIVRIDRPARIARN